jgi:hypothetical protein
MLLLIRFPAASETCSTLLLLGGGGAGIVWAWTNLTTLLI